MKSVRNKNEIRELFKLLGKPGIISFAGGFPDPALFDVDGLRAASQSARRRCGAAPPAGTTTRATAARSGRPAPGAGSSCPTARRPRAAPPRRAPRTRR